MTAEADGGARQPVEAIVVTGFLGAGKTSFIRHVLLPWLMREHRPALLVNDAGEENFDAERLAEAGVPLVSVAGGCGCCAVAGAMAEAIARLAQAPHRPLVVEGSGLAEPAPLLEALRSHGFSDVFVLGLVYGPSSRERLSIAPVQAQLAAADWILVTAAEETAPADLAFLQDRLSRRRRRPVVAWRRDVGVLDPRWPAVLETWGGPGAPRPADLRCDDAGAPPGEIATRTLRPEGWASREMWERWVQDLPAGVWRVKGLVPVHGAVWPQGLDHNGAGTPAWHAPAGPREPYLVLVGEAADLETLPPLPAASPPEPWDDAAWMPPGCADRRGDAAWRAGVVVPPRVAARCWLTAVAEAGAEDLVWLSPAWTRAAEPERPRPPLTAAAWQILVRRLRAWSVRSPDGRWLVAGWPLAFVQALARLAEVPPHRIWHAGEAWAWPEAALSWLAPGGTAATQGEGALACVDPAVSETVLP